MLVRVVLSVCCLLFTATHLPVAAVSADKQQPTASSDLNRRFLDPKMNADDWVKRFEGENREIAAGREALVKALKLRPGAAVADVGAGTGLFVEPFSTAVTDKGKVYALEISPAFVKHLKKRVEEKGLKNVEVVLSKEDSTELPEASVDVVFVCEIEQFPDFILCARPRNAIRKSLECSASQTNPIREALAMGVVETQFCISRN